MRLLPLLTAVMLAAATPAIAHDGHVHQTHDVAIAAAPAITSFTVSGSPADGFIVSLDVENFTFVEAGEAPPVGQNAGHARLYINGSDLGIYDAPDFTLEELPYGPHDFRVVLIDTAHADFAVNGRAIAATTTFTVE